MDCVKSVRIPSYSVRVRENADQNNSKWGQFLRNVDCIASSLFKKKTNEIILFFELVYIFFKIGNVIFSKFENLKKEILCSLSSSSAKDAKVSPKSLGTT